MHVQSHNMLVYLGAFHRVMEYVSNLNLIGYYPRVSRGSSGSGVNMVK